MVPNGVGKEPSVGDDAGVVQGDVGVCRQHLRALDEEAEVEHGVPSELEEPRTGEGGLRDRRHWRHRRLRGQLVHPQEVHNQGEVGAAEPDVAGKGGLEVGAGEQVVALAPIRPCA